MANDNDQDKVVIRTVSLYPEDWMEVDTLARATRLSVSAAMRRIIDEWRELRDPGPEDRMDMLVKAYRKGHLTHREFVDEMQREAHFKERVAAEAAV